MRGLFSFVALLVALAVVAVIVRNQLRETQAVVPAASAASAPFEGSSSPTLPQYQRELDKAMQGAAERAASAGGDADR